MEEELRLTVPWISRKRKRALKIKTIKTAEEPLEYARSDGNEKLSPAPSKST